MIEGVTSDSYRELSDHGVDTHNSRMIALLRANGGVLPGVPDSEMRVLILTITGARSGVQRETPLGYIEHEGRRYIAGSNGGQEPAPAWVFNVRANPAVTAAVAARTYAATIRELRSEERDDIFAVLVGKHRFFGEYQAGINRTIPVFELVQDSVGTS